MKGIFKFFSILILISLIMVLVACNDEVSSKDELGNKNGLHVDSNVEVNSRRVVSFDDFLSSLDSVEYVFHDGDVTTPLGMKITDPELFYVEYDEETNECTFFIPFIVKRTFEEKAGEEGDTANSFIWYMTEYQGKVLI